LTRPLDRHLDSDELDALVLLEAPGVSVARRLSEEALREIRRHVESCQDCDRKVQMHRSAQNAISLRVTSGQAAKGSNCSEESEWVRVAAGLLENTEAKERMKHAIQCGYCGPLLKAAVRSLSEETTPDEEAALASLTSAGRDWQAQMARRLRKAVENRSPKEAPSFWRSLFHWPNRAFAVATVAIVAMTAWIGVRMLRPPSAQELLAQAYTERRTIEMRIPGAKYAPIRVERSGGGSSFEKPEPLLKAEAVIGENLRKTPNDPLWLQGKARADLLDGNYDSAINTLQRALDIQSDSSSLLTDLGSAYFLRGESTTRPVDFGLAIEALSKALATSPNDQVALFNRAIVCEHMFLFNQAVDDWEHYLRVDGQGEWSNEARRRLAALKQKLQQHNQSQSTPLLTPAEIAKVSPGDTEIDDKIDARIEEYLHTAIIKWLPDAFSSSQLEQNSSESHSALSVLAEILKTRHQDSWLADLLSRTSGPHFFEALEALSIALRGDDRGDYSGARDAAHHSAELFKGAANTAGELRAQGEEVYADHLLWEGTRCISLLQVIRPRLDRYGYGWLQGQMSLEESNCANLVGDLGTYQSAINKGIAEAEKHRFDALYIRGLGFRALSVGSLGDVNNAFLDASRGLKRFWSEHVDVMKGYNLYYDLDAAADQMPLPNLQVALWREATTLIDVHPDVLLRAMAHRWYGNAAYLDNMPDLAAAEYGKASALFAASPPTSATTRDRMDAEVWQASAEIRRGDLERAAVRLQTIKPIVDSEPSFDPEIAYYSTEADIALKKYDDAAAESALRSAVFLAEWALKSISSEDDRRHWARQTQNAYRSAVEWKLRQGDPTSALELWEWYRGAELRTEANGDARPETSLEITVPPNPQNATPLPSPVVVQSQLPLMLDETVVAYAMFSDGIAVWVYDDRGIQSKWISTSQKRVRDLVTRFVRLCSDPASDLSTLRTTGSALYKLLVTPIESQLASSRTLLFELDDDLLSIPVEALVDSEGHYVAERSVVVVAPPLYRQLRLHPPVPITPELPALVVSVPAPPEAVPSLEDAEREAQSVSAKFRNARYLDASKATLSAIRREIRGSAVFHFAGHAVFSPQRSGLMLGERDPMTKLARVVSAGSLSARETADLELAVLSACNTKGQETIGHSGTESIAESLLHAGVPHVIASRWSVDSTQTTDLMNQFYTRLLTGSTVAEALHSAQLAMASRPASIHPYYWAPFELEGIR
jgi:CHAT domain-containing protein/tetratricopeptide (TPR) repeat protein